jgi:MFS family permease
VKGWSFLRKKINREEDNGSAGRLANEKTFSWRFMTPLYIGSSLNPINSSLIATALPNIAGTMDVSIGATAILVGVLYLACAVAQPTCGKLAEVVGPRRVFLIGIFMVLIGGIIGGLAWDLPMLIVSRIVIGIGTSAGYPSAMILIRRRADSLELGEAPGSVLGGLQIAATATATFGLPIGGLLVGGLGWRSVFFVNVPVALIAWLTASRWIAHDPAGSGVRSFKTIAAEIDVVGILWFSVTMTALLSFLFSLPEANWLTLLISAAGCALLIFRELRTRRPFFDIRLLTTNLALTRTYIRIALLALCVYTVMYGLSQWLEAGQGLSAETTGLLLLPMSAISALIMPPLSRRNLVRGPLIASAATSLFASIGVLLLTVRTPMFWIVFITCIFGVTMGTMALGNQIALYTQVSSDQIGTASGLLRTFTYIGSIGSSAIISIGFHQGASVHGLHLIALVMIAMSTLALAITLFDHQIRPRAIMSQR